MPLRSVYRVMADANEDIALVSLTNDSEGSWTINQLTVHPAERKAGSWGAALLRLVCRHADEDGATLVAFVVPEPDVDPARLQLFYEHLGFVTSPNDDGTFGIRREPRG